jgi:hypothetical protein
LFSSAAIFANDKPFSFNSVLGRKNLGTMTA